MSARLVSASAPGAIKEAARILRESGLVVLPTETVYGLGANACDGRAVAKIFEAKGRPSFNPLIVHVTGPAMARELVHADDRAEIVMERFWPGPLTLVLPRRAGSPVSDLCSAGLPTLALRMPAHPVMQAVLKASALPVAAPSANKSGNLSPTTPAHVVASLGNDVDLILAAGACTIGLESTVLDLSGDQPAILRLGSVTAKDLKAVLDTDIPYDPGTPDKPTSPGQILRHYAPRTPLRLNAVDVTPEEALLAFGSLRFMGIKGGGAASQLPADRLRNLSETGDLHEAAANLFRMLHDLDASGATRIAAMNIPEKDLGMAINDRLRRAAGAVE